MAIVINDLAKPVLLTLKLPYLRSLVLRLYQNDYTPVDGPDEASSYVEADFSGYEPQDLSDLGNAYLNEFGLGESDTETHEWTQNNDVPENTIYGYYVTDVNGYLIFAERNEDGPVVMDHVGATYEMILNFLEDMLR